MSKPSTDSIGNQIISKHAPFFNPGDMAAAIDEAIDREKAALLDELDGWNRYNRDSGYSEEPFYVIPASVLEPVLAQRAKLTKEGK